MEILEVVLFVAGLGLYALYHVWDMLKTRRKYLQGMAVQDRAEAMFKTMFPELQPHFHPERVDEYVFARLDRLKQEPRPGAFGGSRRLLDAKTVWKNPPGFPAAESATLETTEKGERTVLLDSAQKPLAEFLFEARPEGGGVIRLGKGKLTATRDAKDRPSVRYWHPDREFKWKWPKDWRFISRMSEDPISSTESGSSFSSSSSSSSAAPAAAAAAGLAGLGGTFDGGGASQGWDDRGGSAGGESSTASDAFAGAGVSGSSDTGSGSDSGSGSGDSSSSSDTSY
jgi:hypothetical protein